jgi:hypothetical protein
MNAMATLGALTIDSGQIFVGSRLTIYEDAENRFLLLDMVEFLDGHDLLIDLVALMQPPTTR